MICERSNSEQPTGGNRVMRVQYCPIVFFVLAVIIWRSELNKVDARFTGADDTDTSSVYLPIVINHVEMSGLPVPSTIVAVPTTATPTESVVSSPTVDTARGTAVPTATPLTAPLEPAEPVFASCVDTYETDIGDDGVPEYSVRSEYDEFGRAERRVFDDGADAAMDTVTEYSYEGAKLSVVTLRDLDTGIETERHELSYTTDGNLESWTITGADREPLSLEYQYNANDRLVRMEQDQGLDGRIDKAVDYEYYSDGKLKNIHDDFNGDGGIDSVMDYVWKDNLHVEIGSTLTRTGERAIESFEYDTLTRVVRRSHFANAAAEAPFMEFLYTYDSNDQVIRFEWYREGRLAQKTSYGYDELGREVEKFLESMSAGPTRTTHFIHCEVDPLVPGDYRNIRE